MSLEDVLSRLSKTTRDKVLSAKELELVKVPVASMGLNRALGGGVGKGRIVTWWGAKSAGKSVICYENIVLAQERGEVCMLVDAEDSYDPVWAARLGVDVENLIVIREKAISDVTNIIVDHINAGVETIVLDSISALVPASFYEKDGSLKNQEDTGQIGALSKGIGSMLKIINSVNRGRCTIHLISQFRNKIGAMHTMPAPEGGEALKFYSSVIVKLWSTAVDAKQIKEDFDIGGKKISKNVGRTVGWVIEYSKTSEPNQNGSYAMFYHGDNVGIDAASEVVDIAIETGVFVKSGAWVKYGEEAKYRKHWEDRIRTDVAFKKEILEAIDD